MIREDELLFVITHCNYVITHCHSDMNLIQLSDF